MGINSTIKYSTKLQSGYYTGFPSKRAMLQGAARRHAANNTKNIEALNGIRDNLLRRLNSQSPAKLRTFVATQLSEIGTAISRLQNDSTLNTLRRLSSKSDSNSKQFATQLERMSTEHALARQIIETSLSNKKKKAHKKSAAKENLKPLDIKPAFAVNASNSSLAMI